MHQPVLQPKIVIDPLWGIIDITEFVPLIDTPQFQALGFKYQLGVTSLIYPAATHTRKQHSLGAYHRTKMLTDRWVRQGTITADEARLASAYGLLHDIGHGPFSHVIEEVTKELWQRDHDANGVRLIGQMKEPLERAGVQFDDFRKIFDHVDPLYLAVHDKNLGAEKLDYLSRDAFYTIGEVPGVEYLALYTHFIDGQIMIDERAIDQAKSIQDFYVKMYKNVYLRKNSAIGQRLIQKMTGELIQTERMGEEDFWRLTDFGLLGLFETARSKLVREYYEYFMTRRIPKTAVALRPEEFVGVERVKNKAMTVFGMPMAQMQRIATSPTYTKPSLIRSVEKGISEIAGIPEEAVLIVPPLNIERFIPQDIRILTSQGKTALLSNYFTDHFKSLAEEGKSYVVLRICALPEYRERLSEPSIASRVRDYIATTA